MVVIVKLQSVNCFLSYVNLFTDIASIINSIVEKRQGLFGNKTVVEQFMKSQKPDTGAPIAISHLGTSKL